MTAGRSPGEQAAADRPAGHDAHQEAAAELRRRIHETLGWPLQDALIAAALAAAEQRGRDDTARSQRELAELAAELNAEADRTPEMAARITMRDAAARIRDVLRALADRTEATT